jgi:ATP/maltotriose-dependent transcriptional regulator MalT
LIAETLDRMGTKLGDSHPLALSCAANLANCQGAAGDLGNAETLQRRTVAQLQGGLGPDNPDSLVCQGNLTVTLQQTGHALEAEELRARISTDFIRVVGTNHPDTARLRVGQRIYRDLEEPPI